MLLICQRGTTTTHSYENQAQENLKMLFNFLLCFRAVICLCTRQVLVYHALKDLQKIANATLQLQVGNTLPILFFSLNTTFNLTFFTICTYIININLHLI